MNSHDHDPMHEFLEAMRTYKFLIVYIAIIVTALIILKLVGWK